MYHWVTDKKLLKLMNMECSSIINEYKMLINNEGHLKVDIKLVGSGARNMILQNGDNPIDLDYNLSILRFFSTNDPHQIKEYLRNLLNMILKKHDWNDCKDSTSAFTTEQRYFTNYQNKTAFSFDVAITFKNKHGTHRLVRNKSHSHLPDSWSWELMKNSNGLDKRIKWIKTNNLWEEVRETYRERKNKYRHLNDINHSSHICFIEAVNEIYYGNVKH